MLIHSSTNIPWNMKMLKFCIKYKNKNIWPIKNIWFCAQYIYENRKFPILRQWNRPTEHRPVDLLRQWSHLIGIVCIGIGRRRRQDVDLDESRRVEDLAWRKRLQSRHGSRTCWVGGSSGEKAFFKASYEYWKKKLCYWI